MINYDFWQKSGQHLPVTEYTPPNAGLPEPQIGVPPGEPPYQQYQPGPGMGAPVTQPVPPDYTGGPMGFGDFNFPSAWGGLENFYGNLMGGGMNMPLPGLWGAGSNRLQQMMQTGEPVDISGWMTANMPPLKTKYEDLTYDIFEEAGVGGTRGSSGSKWAAAEQGRRLMENFGGMAAQLELASKEAGMTRAMASLGMIPGYIAQNMQQKLMNLQAQMAGAEGMFGFGQQQMFAPMQLAQGMMGLGGGYQNAQQNMLNNMMNDPYLQMALAMGGQGSQYMPNQFLPGWASQFMNVGGNMMGAAPWMQGQGYSNPYSQIAGAEGVSPDYGSPL